MDHRPQSGAKNRGRAGLLDTIGQVIGQLAVLLILLLALSLMIGGGVGTRRAAGRVGRVLTSGLWHALRFTTAGILLVVFTLFDATITIGQNAMAPQRTGDIWANFLLRLNDRTLRMIWH